MNDLTILNNDMKDWLGFPDYEALTLYECLYMAHEEEEWRCKMFYAEFLPRMAILIDGLIKDQRND